MTWKAAATPGWRSSFTETWPASPGTLTSGTGTGQGFLAVNGTDGVGRSKANIQVLRAWWADLDEKAASATFRPEDLPLAPSLVIQSGHGAHLYWRTREPWVRGESPAPPGPRSRTQAHPGGPRRLWCGPGGVRGGAGDTVPGFWNRKREPHQLVELTSSRPVHYTPEAIRAAFPALSDPKEKSSFIGTLFRGTDEKSRRARAYAQSATASTGPFKARRPPDHVPSRRGEDRTSASIWARTRPSRCSRTPTTRHASRPGTRRNFGGRSRRPCESNRTGDGCWVQADMPCPPCGERPRTRPPRLRKLAKPRLQRRGPQGRPGCSDGRYPGDPGGPGPGIRDMGGVRILQGAGRPPAGRHPAQLRHGDPGLPGPPLPVGGARTSSEMEQRKVAWARQPSAPGGGLPGGRVVDRFALEDWRENSPPNGTSCPGVQAMPNGPPKSA